MKRITKEQVADTERKAAQAMARLQVAQARVRARQKRKEATRHYWLGVVLEGFLFEDAVLLGRVRERIERESPRVRTAFALGQEGHSWFEQPAGRLDSKKTVDTRRFRLGMVLERLLPGDEALIARVEGLIREQPSHVQDAFGLEGEGLSWFDLRRP